MPEKIIYYIASLLQWQEAINFNLVARHGYHFKVNKKKEETTLLKPLSNSFKSKMFSF